MDAIKLNINLNVNQLVEAVKQLSPKDRLKINDAIWNDEIEIPIEHQKIVLSRVAKAEADTNRLLDWNKVSKNL
ncbi:hypothetical protein WFZ85_03285 [Flavobacterium sp. j3]|uniref:Addiction module component n=1 Tax=Flavobacterium aureirubrum TaxID=3133147 RepID=A0ABU9N4A7_9FLAO